jgi:hypothetical protein
MKPRWMNPTGRLVGVACLDLFCASSFCLGLCFQINSDLGGGFTLSKSDSAVDVRHGVGACAANRKEDA